MLNYIKIIWEGDDGKPSLKRVMSIVSFITFISVCIKQETAAPEMVITALMGMSLTLLGITTYQTLQYFKGK